MAGIKANWRTSVPKMALAASQLPPKDRDFVVMAVVDVLRAMIPARPQVAQLLRHLMLAGAQVTQPEVTYELPAQ